MTLSARTAINAYPLWREAKVINTTDPEKLGRVQLKVYPELAGITDADCPWCFPFTGGIHGKSFGVPLVTQLVSCVVWNKYWNEISFMPFTITKPTEHLFGDFMKNIRPILKDVPADPEEEHLVVERYEDGFSQFHDTKNRQHGFAHPSGAHCTINRLGDIFVSLVKNLTVHNGGSAVFKVDPENNSVSFHVKGDFDVASDAPVGIKGSGVYLGEGVLQPYWDALIDAYKMWPLNAPVPPAPPIIAAALNALNAAVLQSAKAAKENCAKSVK